MSDTSQKPQAIPSSLQPDNPGGGGLEGQDLSLRHTVRILRKRKRVVFLTALALTGLTILFVLLVSPRFPSSAEIEVERDQQNPMDSSLGSIASSIGGSDDTKVQIQTEVSILQSDDLAIETMELMHYEANEKKYALHLFGDGNRIPSEVGLPLAQAPNARKSLIKDFESHLKVDPQEGTRLIQVTFTDRDAKYASEITTTLVDQYVRDRLERRNSSTLQATDWMSGQISELNKKVESSQEALIDYQKKSGLIALPAAPSNSSPGQMNASGGNGGMEIRSPALDRFVQLNQQLESAEIDRISKEAVYRVAQSGDPAALAAMGSSQLGSGTAAGTAQSDMFSGLASLRQQEVALQVQLTSATATYGPNNPHLQDLKNQLGELEKQIKEEVKRIVNRAQLDYQMALKTESDIRAEYEKQLKGTDTVNDAQIHLAVLQQEADSTRMLYEDLYTKLEESKLSVGTQASNIALISKALQQAEPAYPRPILYTIISIPIGLLLGMMAAFVVDTMDDAIVTTVEAEEFTGLAVLASIPDFAPFLKEASKKAGMEGLNRPVRRGSWLVREPHSPISEAYRAFRTSLLLSQPGSPPKALLITSSLPGEGKTTTAYNLAACFATGNKRVLVIDADLRKPSLHLHVGSDNKAGLSTLLTENVDPATVIATDADIPTLSVLTAGMVPPNPSELLSSSTFDTLLRKLIAEYDFVFIDSPPIMLVTDAVVLSHKVDGCVVVAKSGTSVRAVLRRTIQLLRRNRANILGLALNSVDTSSSEYYYSNGYYGRSYYGNDKE